MQNVSVKLDAATVQQIVEKHLNESLTDHVHARATNIAGSMAPNCVPNQPNHELFVTFDVTDRPSVP